jgi:hypothetical protein
MDKKYSRQVLSELEKITKKAHDNERRNNLKGLSKSIKAWEKGGMTDDEMEKIISEYRPIRVIWADRRYLENGDPGLPVVDALMSGSLTMDDLSPTLQRELEILKKVVEI